MHLLDLLQRDQTSNDSDYSLKCSDQRLINRGPRFAYFRYILKSFDSWELNWLIYQPYRLTIMYLIAQLTSKRFKIFS